MKATIRQTTRNEVRKATLKKAMEEIESMRAAIPHAGDPFDDSACERHHRMGLLTKGNEPELPTIEALAKVEAGIFFDHICDVCSSYQTVMEIGEIFLCASKCAEPKRQMMMISIQYDLMQLPLPDTIWWLVGTPALRDPFLKAFFAHLEVILEEGQKLYGQGEEVIGRNDKPEEHNEQERGAKV